MTGSKWHTVLESLDRGDFAAAERDIEQALAGAPLDSDAMMLRGVVKASQGRDAEAEADLWRSLAITPDLAGARAALGDLVVRDLTHPDPGRDFSLSSGERQTASRLEGIRRDHLCRYEFAALWLRDHLAPAHRVTGIDVFCGNGYGSRLLADRAGCRMIGLDGSAQAVAQAHQAYADHRVVFRQACFPFDLAPRAFAFAVSFESVEHVTDHDAFLSTLDQTARGPILLSFPLETTLRFDLNADLFSYHVRHFTLDEMAEKLARLCRRRITAVRGQTVYHLREGRVTGTVPAERMELTALLPDSQFAVIVAEKES
jgi:SAM-dependent methyltransferase